MVHSWIMLSLVTLFGIRVTFAQFSNVECSANYSWTKNIVGESPCTIASSLEAQCYPGGFNISALSSGSWYIGPNTTQANSCECNAVVYSLVSACGACQGSTWVSWHSWIAECSNYTSYDLPEAPGIIVPSWAYLSIGTDGFWNMTAAYKNAVLSATSTQTLATTSATSSPSSSSSSSTNLGVIIGGVVGGVIGGLILVSVVVFYVQRRRKENHATPYPLSSMIHNTSPSSFIQSVYDTPTGSCMLYDPENPNTFLKSMEPMTFVPANVYQQRPELYA